ncbi:hypothetical protein GCM10010302_66380 [Streptomyces polychromogenes]|uniref:Uncharacterized protein n=1 Tax=Streptomyces polychromogenes TaxID=67342 RepID=A0ABN0VV19_9ACTN
MFHLAGREGRDPGAVEDAHEGLGVPVAAPPGQPGEDEFPALQEPPRVGQVDDGDGAHGPVERAVAALPPHEEHQPQLFGVEEVA